MDHLPPQHVSGAQCVECARRPLQRPFARAWGGPLKQATESLASCPRRAQTSCRLRRSAIMRLHRRPWSVWPTPRDSGSSTQRHMLPTLMPSMSARCQSSTIGRLLDVKLNSSLADSARYLISCADLSALGLHSLSGACQGSALWLGCWAAEASASALPGAPLLEGQSSPSLTRRATQRLFRANSEPALPQWPPLRRDLNVGRATSHLHTPGNPPRLEPGPNPTCQFSTTNLQQAKCRQGSRAQQMSDDDMLGPGTGSKLRARRLCCR